MIDEQRIRREFGGGGSSLIEAISGKLPEEKQEIFQSG
jgi:hypothetical protein